MNKHWTKLILILVVVLTLLIFAFLIINRKVSFINKNFPLQEQWTTNINESIEGLSTLDEQTVLVRTSNSLYALETKTGKILWHYKLARQAIPEPAIVVNDTILIADGEKIVALDSGDGSIIWEQYVAQSDTRVIDASKNVVAVKVEQNLNIYDTTGGTLLWSKPVCRNDIQAYLLDSNVYVPCYGIRAMDIYSGDDIWEISNSERIAKVAYDNGIMYFSPDQASVVAFDLQGRMELWETHLFSKGYTQFRVLNDILFMMDSYQLCALAKANGTIMWCVRSKNPQNPIVIDGITYVFDGSNKEITAIDIIDGMEIGLLRTNKFSIFKVYKKLMVSTGDRLVFGVGTELFGFGR